MLSARWLPGLREEQMLCVLGREDPASQCHHFLRYKVGVAVPATQVCLRALKEFTECLTQCLSNMKYYISTWVGGEGKESLKGVDYSRKWKSREKQRAHHQCGADIDSRRRSVRGGSRRPTDPMDRTKEKEKHRSQNARCLRQGVRGQRGDRGPCVAL